MTVSVAARVEAPEVPATCERALPRTQPGSPGWRAVDRSIMRTDLFRTRPCGLQWYRFMLQTDPNHRAVEARAAELTMAEAPLDCAPRLVSA